MAGLEGSKKRSDSSHNKLTRFGEVLGAARESESTSEILGTQQPEQLETQKLNKKRAKREDPSYTQCTFRIPKKLSRQMDRVLIDLADEGIEIDRSDLLEIMAEAFIRISDKRGAVTALQIFKNLGTQNNG
jgi:hypothetical protein